MVIHWFKQFLWATGVFAIVLAAQATQTMLQDEYQAYQTVQESQKMAENQSYNHTESIF